MPKRSIAFMILLAAAVPAGAQNKPNEARSLSRSMGMEGLSGKKLKKAIAKAEKSPLGSEANPVRENMPEGQRAYLARLRCADGTSPKAERRGSVGVGVFGNIVDLYSVTCAGAEPVPVHMDMYHDGPELRPIAGFTMAPE